jgi:hypothetical protein
MLFKLRTDARYFLKFDVGNYDSIIFLCLTGGIQRVYTIIDLLSVMEAGFESPQGLTTLW